MASHRKRRLRGGALDLNNLEAGFAGVGKH